MTLVAEVKDKKADRFRAYAAAKMTRKPRKEDHIKRAKDGAEPFGKGARIRYDVEEVAFEGAVTGESVTIDAGDQTVTKIVFYSGPVENEVVVGSVEVNAAGAIEIGLVEPGAADKPEIVDE